jgi:pPIWI_RE three-gene island domain Y
MRGWRCVTERERPHDRALQLGLDRVAAACALADVPAPRGVRDLVWDWSTSKPLHQWPLVFDADAQVRGELLLIDGEPSEFLPGVVGRSRRRGSRSAREHFGQPREDRRRAGGPPGPVRRVARFVTSHAVLDPSEFLSAKNMFLAVPPWATWLDESYEPIPPGSTHDGKIAVIWLSVTVESVLATCVIRFGNAGATQSSSCLRRSVPPPGQPHCGSSSQVWVTCSLYPSQQMSRLTPSGHRDHTGRRSGHGRAGDRRPPVQPEIHATQTRLLVAIRNWPDVAMSGPAAPGPGATQADQIRGRCQCRS